MVRKNKFLLVVPAAFMLAGCGLSYVSEWKLNFNVFNNGEIAGLFFDYENDYQIVQIDDSVYWGPVDDKQEWEYELRIDGIPDEKSPYTLGKSNLDVLCGENSKLQVFAYNKDGEVKKTPVLTYKKSASIPQKDEADIKYDGTVFTDNVPCYMTEKGQLVSEEKHHNESITIKKEISCIYLTNISSWKVSFSFEKRSTPMYIYLNDVNINGTFSCEPNDTSIYNFIVSETNTIDAGVAEDSDKGSSAIKMPRIHFRGNGNLTVKGGTPGVYDAKNVSGHAIEATRIYNGIEYPSYLTVIGGKGIDGDSKNLSDGKIGRIPLNKDIMIKCMNVNSIFFKSGDGGKGWSSLESTSVYAGDGGNAYSNKCLLNNVYKRYSILFNDYLGDAKPGAGGASKNNSHPGKAGKLLEEIDKNEQL